MAGRRYESDVSIDRYSDRRGGGGGRRYEDRFVDEEIEFRRVAPPPPRERESKVIIREETRERDSSRAGPAYLREDYGRTTAGPVVLRAREVEDFEFVPQPRRRSPSPEPEKKVEREEIIIRRDESESRPPPRVREREYDREEIIIRRDEREREPERRPPPPREREREEIIIRRDEREREPERRPPPPREREREEIIIRRDEREREPERRPPPPRERDREEIIIRREERDRESRAPPPRELEREREDIIIRREDGPRRSRIEIDERDDVVSRRGDYERRPARDAYDREEIIIRRDERESDDRLSRYTSRQYDDYAPSRPKSHERERSRVRRGGSPDEHEHENEIIIRSEEREGRNGNRERQEIIIRRTSHSRSPSPAPSTVSTRTVAAPVLAPPEPQVIHAPAIHQEVITHHRHIDHGYEIQLAPRPRAISRPPSPPSPPPPPPPAPRERSEERIEIRRTGERNGRTYDEDIIIDRNEGRSRPPAPRSPPPREPYYSAPPPRREPMPPPAPPAPYRGYNRDVEEEAEFYNDRAVQRSYIGEGYHGATRDWAIVDVPPGTKRVRMDGAGGGEQEITWQRYNGVRRSKFYADGVSDEGYGSEVGRPAPPPVPASSGEIGRRYGREKDPKEGLWTELTKDLVVKEAIQEMGYEFEETDDFYYIISYLKYEDVARLVGLSEDIRKERRKRVKELEWESRVFPEPIVEEPIPRLAIEAAPPPRREPDWSREDERYIEREIIYRGPRVPSGPPRSTPPPGWGRR